MGRLSAPKVKLAATRFQEAPAFLIRLAPKVAKSARELAEGDITSLRAHQVRAEEAASNDEFDREALAQALRASRRQFRECYQGALAQTPGLNGKLKLRFVIQPSGRLSDAKATTESTLRNQALERCVLAQVRLLTVPPYEGKPATIALPLAFELSP